MIQVLMTRLKDGQIYDYPVRKIDTVKALEILLKCELGFGAEITSIATEHLTLTTIVMGCKDTTTFTGTQLELEPLIQATYFFMKSTNDFDKEIFKQAFKEASMMEKAESGYEGITPLFAQIGFPMILGKNRLKTTVMYAMGFKDEEKILKGLSVRFEDLLIAIQMEQAGVCTFAEALS